MWYYLGTDIGLDPMEGVGEGPYTDVEFDVLNTKYNKQWPDSPDALKASTLWRHVDDTRDNDHVSASGIPPVQRPKADKSSELESIVDEKESVNG